MNMAQNKSIFLFFSQGFIMAKEIIIAQNTKNSPIGGCANHTNASEDPPKNDQR